MIPRRMTNKTRDECCMSDNEGITKSKLRKEACGCLSSFELQSEIDNHVLILAKILFASSNVSLLPMSSHLPLIWKVFTDLRV